MTKTARWSEADNAYALNPPYEPRPEVVYHFGGNRQWCIEHGYHIVTTDSEGTDHRYILVRLDDAREIADTLKTQQAVSSFRAALSQRFAKALAPRVQLFVERVEVETGADLQDIVGQLKAAEPCHACVVEAQLRSCVCWRSNKLGRRLARLIERADNPQGAS